METGTASPVHGVGGPIPIYRNRVEAWGGVATAMRFAASACPASSGRVCTAPQTAAAAPAPALAARRHGTACPR